MRNRPPPGQLAPHDDGVRFIVERPTRRSPPLIAADVLLKPVLVVAAADEATARMWLRPGDTLAVIRIDGCGRELEREVIPWLH